MTTGPVGMAATPIGMVFLYEMGAGDVTEFARQPYEAAIDRVRWLLTRVASKASAAGLGSERPAMLERAEVASLGDDDVQSIVEVFLSSPENEWQSHRAEESGAVAPRAADESAVQYLDRLVQWRSALPLQEAARRPQAPSGFPSLASTPPNAPFPAAPPRADPPMSRVLTWVSAGLALTVLLSVAALAFGAMSYFEARADQEANALWRAEMRRMQAARPSPAAPAGAEKLVSELSAENARLRYRLQLAEEKARSAARTASSGNAAERKSSTRPRSGRQARDR